MAGSRTDRDGRPQRPPKMADIAERAGVAKSTVSYALSGKKPVSADARQRIERAIEELQFRPHAAAQALKRRTARTIELFFPAAEDTVESPIFLAGAAEATSEADYGLLVSTAVQDPAAISAAMETGRADGVVLLEVRQHDERVDHLRDAGHPFSLIGTCASNRGLSYVDFDFEDAARQAVDHLAELGHQRILFLNRDPYRAGRDYGPTVRLQAAFEAAIEDHGIKGEHLLSGASGEHFIQTLRFLERNPAYTGALTISTTVAPLMWALGDLDRPIPEHMEVVSILAPQVAKFVPPQLATIEMPAKEMGRLGAEILIRRLADPEAPLEQIMLRGILHPRAAGPSGAGH